MQRNGFGLNATFVTAAGAGIMDVMLPISGERKSYVLDLLADCRTVRDRVGKRPQIHLRIHSGMAERERLRHSNPSRRFPLSAVQRAGGGGGGGGGG